MGIIKCLKGKKFKYLEVLDIVSTGHNRGILYNCKCVCGNITTGYSTDLRAGKKSSCGCMRGKSLINVTGKNHAGWKGYEDIPRTFWDAMIISANNRKLVFDVTIEYLWEIFIIQDKKCALSKLPLTFDKKCRNASLDRKDNTQGYITGNIHWIDKRINYMKQDYTMEEFLYWCRKVSEFNNG